MNGCMEFLMPKKTSTFIVSAHRSNLRLSYRIKPNIAVISLLVQKLYSKGFEFELCSTADVILKELESIHRN